MGKEKKGKNRFAKKRKEGKHLEKAKRAIKDRKFMERRRRQKRKVYHTTKFSRKKTLRKNREPQYAKKMNNEPLKKNRFSKYDILRYPVGTEAVTKHIEEHNTIVFVCDRRANKKQIKKAFSEMFECKVVKVRTQITPKGEKKAHIKLQKDEPATDIASKINIC